MEPNQPRAGHATSFTTMHTSNIAAMERLLEKLQSSETVSEEPADPQYLFVTCAGIKVALALASLREVLPSLPVSVALPFSPPWLLGIIPLRNEMLGLVDPVPVLFPEMASTKRIPSTRDLLRQPQAAIVVGGGEQSLAWAIDDVGDIAQIAEDTVVAYERRPDDHIPTSRYALGAVRCPESGSEYMLLDAKAALDEMLHALVESDRSDE